MLYFGVLIHISTTAKNSSCIAISCRYQLPSIASTSPGVNIMTMVLPLYTFALPQYSTCPRRGGGKP